MTRKRMMGVATVGVLLWPAIVRSWSGASGVQTLVTLFESHRHPDLPLEQFAAGRLGLIKPTWSSSYRFAAYRYLVGPGLNPAEQKALVSMWDERLGLEQPGETAPQRPLEPRSARDRDIYEAASGWLNARNQVPGVLILDGIGAYKLTQMQTGNFVITFYFPNCNSTGFRTAASTLQAMTGKFGASSPEVKRWVEAQDQVFDNCSDTPGPFAAIPLADPQSWTHSYQGWVAERAKVPGISTTYGLTSGCREEGIKAATVALETMIRNSGAASPQVKQWVEAQDRVFQKCGHPFGPSAAGSPTPAPTPDIPQPLPHGDPFEQAERTYQIACANFYSGKFDEAARMFDAIAADRFSPWREWAPYLVARATIRKATLSGPKNDLAILTQAETRLKAIVAATDNDTIKAAAQRLLSFVEFKLHPEQRVEEVERAIMRPGSAQTLVQDLSDYDDMSGLSTKGPGDFYVDDLTDWLATFSEANADSADHSIARWKKTGSVAWLIAAISVVPGSDAKAPGLIDAAEKVKPESPAYVTVTFHAARLLVEQGKAGPARSKLDPLLAMGGALPRSTVNELARLRMRTARNLDELLIDAQRIPLGITDTGDGDELPSNLDVPWLAGSRLKELLAGPLFDRDSAEVLSRWVPLSIQQRAAQSPVLRDDLRGQMALAAWTRAVLLGDQASARGLAPLAGKSFPELRPSLDAWLAAKDTPARSFDAAYIMLAHPGMRPYVDSGVGRVTPLDQVDSLRDNWWRFPSWYEGSLMGRGLRSPPSTYPIFLSTAQKKSADDEWRKLLTINAPNFLCAAAIGEARRSPGDERVSEALSRCISAVHLGCSNDQGSEYAKSAYYLLHRHYAESKWAINNRFWYRGGGCAIPN